MADLDKKETKKRATEAKTESKGEGRRVRERRCKHKRLIGAQRGDQGRGETCGGVAVHFRRGLKGFLLAIRHSFLHSMR